LSITDSLVDLSLVASSGGLTIGDLPAEVPGVRMELIDGSLIVTSLGDVGHQLLITRFCRELAPPAGLEVLAGVNVIVGDRTLLIPDVAVIDPLQLAGNGLGVTPAGLHLVVEVTSPSTRVHDLTTKRELYRQWNVPSVIVDRKAGLPVAVSVEGQLPEWAKVLLPPRDGPG